MRLTSNRAITLFGPLIERTQLLPDIVLPAVVQSPPHSFRNTVAMTVALRTSLGGIATTEQSVGQSIPVPVMRPPGPAIDTLTGQPNPALTNDSALMLRVQTGSVPVHPPDQPANVASPTG